MRLTVRRVCLMNAVRVGFKSLAAPLTACGQDREDLMSEGRRTRPGATSAWAPAKRVAVGLTERSLRQFAYDELRAAE